MTGKVYLVGGGPGALDLYTLKAMECIQEADCLVYDRLIDPQILSYTKKECECIYVGKAANQHTLPQEQINQLLLEKARQYQNVVRLKGGDVYVFGRGGEEALVLQENGIRFEVVPGLSSSIAGLCYAGIPITHRGLASGFEVVTAHHKNDTEYEWDYHEFLNDHKTYVFMMGLSELERITEGLLQAGKAPSTPMALISNATLPNQKTCYGELDTIVDLFKQSDLTSPMLIVMGKTVELHDRLNFFSQGELSQKRILVTTLSTETQSLSHYFKSEGAIVTQVQIGEICLLDFEINFDWENKLIVFTSRNGIRGFFGGLYKKGIDLRQLASVRFACIGQKCAQELASYGFISDIVCVQANSEEFNPLLRKEILDEETMLIVCGQGSCAIEAIRDEDIYLTVYENKEIDLEISSDVYDVACFSSASAVQRTAKSNIQFKTAVSIGKMTTKAIRSLYPDAYVIEAETASYEGMIQAVKENKHVL